jgi:glycosyltransferase involved in cell wall biosynthesis
MSLPRREGDVFRWLHGDLADRHGLGRAVTLLRQEISGRWALERLAARCSPDVVYVWSPRFVSLAPLLIAPALGLPVCCYVSDDWLARWDDVDTWRNTGAILNAIADTVAGPRRPGRPSGIHAQFASEYLKQACLEAGWALESAPVIRWGVDTRRFAPGAPASWGRPRLLYVGQVVPHKGVHTAIDACRLLAQWHGLGETELTIVGGTTLPAYLESLKDRAGADGLAGRVHFMGSVARDRLPAIYRAHDVLVFPSIWPEPFSLTLLEAMASGMAVVATATGGSAELLRHEANALVFPPEDATACAGHVRRLAEEPDLRSRMQREARRTVEESFDLERMLDDVESDLRRLVTS